MATSGTYTYNPTIDTIIQRALRQVGAIEAGETPAAEESQQALDAANALVKGWMGTGIHVFAETDATLFLQPGQASYQIGLSSPDHCCSSSAWSQFSATAPVAASTGVVSVSHTYGPALSAVKAGDALGIQLAAGTMYWNTVLATDTTANTITMAQTGASMTGVNAGATVVTYPQSSVLVRPLRVPSARRYLFSGGIENPLIVMSRVDYAEMPNKLQTGAVTQWFFDPQMVYSIFNVWLTPADLTAAVKFTAQMPLQDFDSLTNTAGFPQEWLNAITWNLALDVAPEYDVPPERFQIIQQRAAYWLGIAQGWDKEIEPIYFGMDFGPSGQG